MFRGVNSETKEPMQKQVPSNFPTCKEGLRLLYATDMGVPDNLRRNRGAREIPGGLSYTLLHCTKHRNACEHKAFLRDAFILVTETIIAKC